MRSATLPADLRTIAREAVRNGRPLPAPARTARIVGLGHHVPPEVVPNGVIADRIGVDDQWIVKRTGIKSRRRAAPADRLTDLATFAGRRALADAGRQQAEAVAEQLVGLKKVDVVYASPLERARETAAAIARRLGVKVRVERGLTDCDYGDWTGTELKALRRLPEWEAIRHYPSRFRFPSGESFTEMQARLSGTLARLLERHSGGTVVAVSHADPIKAAVADAAGTPLDLFQRLVISPCSVSAIAYGDAGPTVLSVNSLDDLAELRPS